MKNAQPIGIDYLDKSQFLKQRLLRIRWFRGNNDSAGKTRRYRVRSNAQTLEKALFSNLNLTKS